MRDGLKDVYRIPFFTQLEASKFSAEFSEGIEIGINA